MAGKDMGHFWDRRAEDDPYHFIDSRIGYGSADADRFWRSGREDLDALLDALEVSLAPSAAVLEIGCGIGRLTRVLASRARSVIALDVSERMVERARTENPDLENVRWLVGDGSSLAGVPDAAVDACVSYVVFQHIPDPHIVYGYVREMGRVLRPGGWAAFQVSTDPRVHRPLRGLARLRHGARVIAGRSPRGQTDPAWLGAAVDLAELERAASGGGLVVERLENPGTQFCLALARRH